MESSTIHVHILEAYANLQRAAPDEGLLRDVGRLLELWLTKIYNTTTWHMKQDVAVDWTATSDVVRWGHDFEAAWVLYDSGLVRANGLSIESIPATGQASGADPSSKGGVGWTSPLSIMAMWRSVQPVSQNSYPREKSHKTISLHARLRARRAIPCSGAASPERLPECWSVDVSIYFVHDQALPPIHSAMPNVHFL
jgi:hypothetical protein